jgi:hypothetical protein
LNVITALVGQVPEPLDVICTLTADRYQPLSPLTPLTIVQLAPLAPALGTTRSAHASASAAASLTIALARSA